MKFRPVICIFRTMWKKIGIENAHKNLLRDLCFEEIGAVKAVLYLCA